MHNHWYEDKGQKKKFFFKPSPGSKRRETTVSKAILNTPLQIDGTGYQSICELCVNRFSCWQTKRANPKKCANWMVSSICNRCTHYSRCYKAGQRRCNTHKSSNYHGLSGFILDQPISSLNLDYDHNWDLKESFDLAMKIGMKNRVLTWLLRRLFAKDARLYRTWKVPKKKSGERTIMAPTDELKIVQRAILDRILSEITAHKAATGFVQGSNIRDNADCHSLAKVVVSIDLKNFFPSIKFPRVYGVLKKIGFKDRVAGIITALCTWDGALPQGAPTSPALSNIVAYRMDKKLHSFLENNGWGYTRYADDITFSANRPWSKRADGPIDHIVNVVRRIIAEEGFEVNENKVKIMRRGRRQWITGLVVNERPNVIRWKFRQLRAAIHNADTLGLTEAAKKQGISRVKYKRWVEGNLAFHNMVNRGRIQSMARQWETVQ